MTKASPKLAFASRNFFLRPYRLSDYAAWRDAYLAMEPKQNEFDQDRKTDKELSRAEFRKFVQKNEKFAKAGTLYHFGVFEKRTGRLMGFVLLALVLRFNVQSARISYTIFNNYWKHGYGRETAEATIQFAFRRLKLHRLEAEIQPHNRSSLALARRLGFQFEGMRRGAVYFDRKWHDHVIYALLAEDRGIKDTRPQIFS